MTLILQRRDKIVKWLKIKKKSEAKREEKESSKKKRKIKTDFFPFFFFVAKVIEIKRALVEN